METKERDFAVSVKESHELLNRESHELSNNLSVKESHDRSVKNSLNELKSHESFSKESQSTETKKGILLCWSVHNKDTTLFVSHDLIAESSLLRETLDQDPTCTQLELPLLQNYSVEIARLVFDLQTHLLRFQRQLKEPNILFRKLANDSEIAPCMDRFAFQPGILHSAVEFSRLLLIEPVFTILEQWLVRVLCGLNFSDIEKWLSPPPSNLNPSEQHPDQKKTALLRSHQLPAKLQACPRSLKKQAEETGVGHKPGRYSTFSVFLNQPNKL